MKIPYTTKQRSLIRIILIIAACVVAAAAITAVSLIFYDKSIDITVQDKVSVTYKDKLDLSGFSVSVTNTYGSVKKYAVTEDMVEYKRDKIGEQTATVKYKGAKKSFKLTIHARQLDAPVVGIDSENRAILWSKIDGAGWYQVDIDGTLHKTDNLRYDLSAIAKVGTLVVKVVAQPKADDDKYYASSASDPITITKLSPITDLQYKDGQFIWTAVEGAIGYTVKINGSEVKVTENKYPFTAFKVGENVCSVHPRGDDYHWPDRDGDITFKIEKLAPAENISYDWKTGRITWDYPESNAGFTVFINDDKAADTYNRYLAYEFTPSESYKVAVVANSATAISSDRATKILTVIKLDRPSLTLANGSITWGAVPNAEKYEVYVDGDVRIQSDMEVSVANLGAGGHTIRVSCYSEGGIYMSSEYAEIVFTKLADVVGLLYNKETSEFTWTGVPGANQYSVNVNGIKYLSDKNSYTYEGSFKEGTNNIAVNAVPQSSDYVTGKEATLALYKLQKARNVVFSGRELTWEDDNEGCMYTVDVGGTQYTTQEKRLDLTLDTRTEIKIVAYLNSKTVLPSDAYENSFTPLTLATPKVEIELNFRYKDTYDIIISSVLNATKYNVVVYLYAEDGSCVTRTFAIDDSEKDKDGYITRLLDASGKTKIVVEVTAVDESGSYNSSAIAKAEYTKNN